MRAAGLGGELKGLWVEWVHPIVGRWGGIATERPLTDGVAEIQAEGWAGLLRGQVLDQWDQVPEGAPAGLARRALISAVGEEPRFITLGSFDDSGEPISVTLGGQDVLTDVLPQLADDAGLEWVVDADRVLHAGQRIGVDRSADVRFFEGREIVYPYNLADSEFAATPSQRLQIETMQDAARANRGGVLGLRSTPRWREPQITVVPTVTGRTPETTPLQLTIANVNNAWGRCDLGNEIRIVIESASFSGKFRIVGRGFDSVGNVLSLAGEATPDQESA